MTGFLVAAGAISRLLSPGASAVNSDPVLDLYSNRALKVHQLPADGNPEQAIVDKLDQSAIGLAYYRDIDPERSILIHDCALSVPSWCDAPTFSFQSMFREAAKIASPHTLNPDQLAAQWYESMTSTTKDAVLPFPLGEPPFQLLAIANRMDMAQLGSAASGAEMHFLYGRSPGPGATTAPEMLVILEFRLPDFKPDEFRNLGRTWARLKTSPPENYVADLGAALRQAGFSADPNRPDFPTRLRSVSSRFNHPFRPAIWELSQLTLDPASTDPMAHSQFAQAYLEDQLRPNADQLPSYPALFTVTASIMAGGALHVPVGPDVQAPSAITYDAVDVVTPPSGVCDAEANRAVLATQQCTFCHGSETGTAFAHITNRAPGAPSRLSTFLAGTGRGKSTAHPNLSDLYYATGPVQTVTLDYKEFHRAADGNCTIADPKPVVRRFHDIARRTLFMAAILTDPLPNSSQAHLKKAKPSAPGAASRFGTTMKD